MQLLFLGTGAGAPSRRRNVASVALRFDQGQTVWLFDCGEGTQHQLLRSALHAGQIERVFITHLHGDHLFGLPGLLGSRSLQTGSENPLTVYGPVGIAAYLDAVFRASHARLRYDLRVKELSATGLVHADDRAAVFCAPLSHGIPSYGYRIEERPRPGRFRVDKATAASIPRGPLYGRLKRGETVTLGDGRTLRGEDFVEPAAPGRTLAICGDTEPCEAARLMADGVDVLVHEATFAAAEHKLAALSSHSTAVEAARIARSADAQTLILTHISARYDRGDEGCEALLDEARAIFASTFLAEDFWSFDF